MVWCGCDPPLFLTAGPAQPGMTPPQSCRAGVPWIGGSSRLPLLSKAGKPWPGTSVCCWLGVSLSLLCLGVTLGTGVGSQSPSAVYSSVIQGLQGPVSVNAALHAPVPMERAAGGDGSITSGALGGLRSSFLLQAARLYPSHPHIPHVPVGMPAGAEKELWDSARVDSLACIALVPHHHYKGGEKEMFGLEREL